MRHSQESGKEFQAEHGIARDSFASCGSGARRCRLNVQPQPLAHDIVVGPQKRLRQGQKSQQFLLVFNPQRSHKQR